MWGSKIPCGIGVRQERTGRITNRTNSQQNLGPDTRDSAISVDLADLRIGGLYRRGGNPAIAEPMPKSASSSSRVLPTLPGPALKFLCKNCVHRRTN
jgi:hypothetical protein